MTTTSLRIIALHLLLPACALPSAYDDAVDKGEVDAESSHGSIELSFQQVGQEQQAIAPELTEGPLAIRWTIELSHDEVVTDASVSLSELVAPIGQGTTNLLELVCDAPAPRTLALASANGVDETSGVQIRVSYEAYPCSAAVLSNVDAIYAESAVALCAELVAAGPAVMRREGCELPVVNETETVVALELPEGGDAEAGAAEFRRCQACHTTQEGAPNRVGPNLWNIFGRPIADQSTGYSYSTGLAGKRAALEQEGQHTWTFAHLDAWLERPRDFAPGTKMVFAGISGDAGPQRRLDLITYLATLRAAPAPAE